MQAARDAILAAFPDLAGARFTELADGWESLAIDVDGALIFRFPRFERGHDQLAREARLLAVLAPALTLPVPRTQFHPGPPAFAWHRRLPGETLLAPHYAALPEPARDRLAEDLARFAAELHGLDPAPLRQAGAEAMWDWPSPESILRDAWPRLPPGLQTFAERIAAACAALPADPGGTVFGHFDTHGWNLAFDHAASRLHGVFDFAGSGFGALHRDFVAQNFIDPDVTRRILPRYEMLTGRRLDRRRIQLLTGLQRLMELGEATEAQVARFGLLENVRAWAAAMR
ncbi:phosphotransferase family protein [Falsiroseomonas sp. HC035]|uniref:phosphotransferase family protein n=1 Tax=Falsiroseomonas sp. HC035 TaxID=3390999 RepID=UPI003D31D2F6